MKTLFVLLILLISTNAYSATVNTPSNSNLFEDTWQEETIIYMSSAWNQLGKGLLGGRFGKWLKENQKKREQNLENNIAERMKEKYPLDHTVIYEDWLHGLKHYKELEKEIDNPEGLTKLIDHLKKQEKNLKKKGKSMNKKIKDYIKDLEHVRDYWEDNQEKDNAEEIQQLAQQTTITIILGIMAMIIKLMAGVPA